MKENKKVIISIVAFIVVLLGAFMLINTVKHNKLDNKNDRLN